MNVAVEPQHRRAGIATTLIEQIFDEAGAGSRYTLEVRISNDVAIAMYERFGFRPAGHRRRYYHDNGEDALIMWLEPTAVAAGLILAIETSCDDTCAAVVDGARCSPASSPHRRPPTSASAGSSPRSPRATTSSWSIPSSTPPSPTRASASPTSTRSRSPAAPG